MKTVLMKLVALFLIIFGFTEARNLHRNHNSTGHIHKHHHRHRREHNIEIYKQELEGILKLNLTWLSHDQIEVSNDIKTDGNNITELQKEIWLFYNVLKGTFRRNAAKFIIVDCESWLEGIFGDISVYTNFAENIEASTFVEMRTKFQEFLDKNSNETTNEYVEIFMNVCYPLLESETQEFVTSLHEEEENFVLTLFDRMIEKNPNNTWAMRKKADELFRKYEFEEAIEYYDNFLSVEESQYVEKKKADALVFLERYDEAIKLYEKHLELDIENLEINDKLINALISRADQSYDRAIEIIFNKHFKPHLEWLTEKQKHVIRRLRAEGKKAPVIFTKIHEFFDQLEGEAKHDVINLIEHGCIRVLYAVFGVKKAEELIHLKDNSTEGFQVKYKEFFENLEEEGHKRIANAYMSKCRKVLTFETDEFIPPPMITVLLNKLSIEFLYDTGADVTCVGKSVWEQIGKPHIHPIGNTIKGIGGNAKALGRCRVWVEISGIKKREWLFIIEDESPLFGRNWMKSFNLKYNFSLL